jgi:hypothetical protein
MLLVPHREISDVETRETYTVKVFDSSKVRGKDTTERTGTIDLRPVNLDVLPSS